LIAEFPKKVEKMETIYLSKLSLTPKRKVASYVGRLCGEGKLSGMFPVKLLNGREELHGG
jgi:hypothetical protein